MGAVRKTVVVIAVLLISVYFLIGIFGTLPIQYDPIKQYANPSQGAEQMNNSAYGNLTVYHSPILQASPDSPIIITVRATDSSGVKVVGLQYGYYEWVYLWGGWYRQMNGSSGANLTLKSGNTFDGVYSYKIPAINKNITQLQYIFYVIGNDKIAFYLSQVYTIKLTSQANQIFGLDYRLFYLLGIAITLIIGYFTYGKKEEWHSEED